MRRVFASSDDYKDKDEVVEAYPWAAEVFEVKGGWQAFESVDEAEDIKRRLDDMYRARLIAGWG